MLGLARWQWRFVGPGNAEATLRDAWNRTLQLGDRVLPGLPEVQTYGFLETSRRTADLVLSCYRVMTPAPSVATPPHLNRTGGSPGFATLFNGKDLAGWRLPRSANQSWEVVDGVLKGSGILLRRLWRPSERTSRIFTFASKPGWPRDSTVLFNFE